MSVDPNRPDDDEADDEKPKQKRDRFGVLRPAGTVYEFDCPECDASNPWDDGFKEGDEVLCHYCQQELRAVSIRGGKIKWKLL